MYRVIAVLAASFLLQSCAYEEQQAAMGVLFAVGTVNGLFLDGGEGPVLNVTAGAEGVWRSDGSSGDGISVSAGPALYAGEPEGWLESRICVLSLSDGRQRTCYRQGIVLLKERGLVLSNHFLWTVGEGDEWGFGWGVAAGVGGTGRRWVWELAPEARLWLGETAPDEGAAMFEAALLGRLGVWF
jgi:hypothetical protein